MVAEGQLECIEQPHEEGADTHSLSVDELGAYTNYTFSINATNGGAPGFDTSNSTECVVETPQDVPSQPQYLNAESENSTAVLLSWMAPMQKNGILLYYNIMCSYNNGSEQLINVDLNATEDCDLEYLFSDLEPCVTYSFTVAATTCAGIGKASDTVVSTTYSAIPSTADVSSVSATGSHTVIVQWKKPSEPENCAILNYTLRYTAEREGLPVDNDTIVSYSSNSTSETLEGIPADRMVTISVAASTAAGQGEFGESQSTYTEADIPEAPYNLHMSVNNDTWDTLDLNWHEPNNSNWLGETQSYTVRWYNCIDYRETLCIDEIEGTSNWTCVHGISETSYTLGNLTGDSYVCVGVQAFTSNAIGSCFTATESQKMPPGVSDPPTITLLEATSYNEVKMVWEEPISTHGVLKEYLVEYTVNDVVAPNKILPKDDCSTMLDVNGDKNISARVRAITSLEGKWSSRKYTITPVGPPPVPDSNQILSSPEDTDYSSTSTITISFSQSAFKNDNGDIVSYAVLVTESGCHDDKDFYIGNAVCEEDGCEIEKREPGTWGNAVNDECLAPYQATTPGWNPWGSSKGSIKINKAISDEQKFVIGKEECDNENTADFCNGPLRSNTDYKIVVRAFTMCGYSTSAPLMTWTTLVTWWIYILVVVLLTFIVLGILFYYCRNHKIQSDGDNIIPPKPLTDFRVRERPVPLSIFPAYVQNMKKDSNLMFSQEYEDLKSIIAKQPSKDAADLIGNKSKNRFINILPYDHSRVKLAVIDGDMESDYINADYIPGPHFKKEYIATQGPTTRTLNDFWRMIWEEDVEVVVMLTQVMEHGRQKCEQYWPDDDIDTVWYGDIKVHLVSESTLSDHVIRVLEVEKCWRWKEWNFHLG
ncbi:PREDICTED: receptor-type tyrosine-protein phosphatase S-like isoform X2 [Priapulus caudatus]|uniref:Receptor-type tyrosine-protein phosphatase S-like isoform X2 n=1 Tax=Priapulus caudatus TaxID=37621 RepID=A0ABM1EIK2_PRICU|nr:PREDICTED: receptor-type tyrosine-protein phosphatase S-like isoform X2 [Priapulus caudatus]